MPSLVPSQASEKGPCFHITVGHEGAEGLLEGVALELHHISATTLCLISNPTPDAESAFQAPTDSPSTEPTSFPTLAPTLSPTEVSGLIWTRRSSALL